MSDTSPILSLPLLQPSQAQKHVTHNEALRVLDALVQAAVLTSTLREPPPDPVVGDRHIVAPAAQAGWAGRDHAVAVRQEDAWQFLHPAAGWRVHDLARGEDLLWTGAVWQAASEGPLAAARLGIGGATADDVNRLTVSARATLFNHAGGGHQVKVNKAAPADTASLLFQSGFGGRAEMGLAGDDDFAVKVSANGADWSTALRLRGIDGIASGSAVQAFSHDATAGRLAAVAADGGVFGWGAPAHAPLGAVVDNAGNPLPSGLYRTHAATTGLPVAAQGVLEVLNGAGTVQHQRWTGGTTGETWQRMRPAAGQAWTAWRKLIGQAGIVGAVAQSGGIPTGAVIERGSNSNGDYIRLADGTQLCWATFTLSGVAVTSSFAGGFRSFGGTITFPAAFSAAPVITGNCNDVTASDAMLLTMAGTSVSAFPRLWRATSASSVNFVGCYTAVGRWY